ncbi:gastrokine-3 [Cricetulus griseus]|uniref:Gastrokine-3 n=2 Tax=Cricetulus griseus TaxID=10029 RepID=A0A9J7GFW2_CRIGR|nr:gastrokine-3 [Cricetulus griseus]XP_027284464.1 gastrokine-3 [Cricetulus griseus]
MAKVMNTPTTKTCSYLVFALEPPRRDDMKRLMASSILVSIFLVPSLALMNTSDTHPLDGSVGTQTIHVDALRGMASIQDNNVLSEWNGIMDYKNALLAVKLFSKMACVLAKMDLAVFPSLDDITQALSKQASGHYPPTRGLTYTVLPSRVKNLAQYGVPVKDLCRTVPAYFAQQQKEGTALAMDPDSCSELQLLSFMGLSICGEIPGL